MLYVNKKNIYIYIYLIGFIWGDVLNIGIIFLILGD